jgi:hypothetical protein
MSSPMSTPLPRRRHSEGARVTDRTRRGSSPASARTGRSQFAPYFKLATFVPRTCAWQETKGTYWTVEEAKGAARRGVETRLVRVAPGLPGGREVLETFTV